MAFHIDHIELAAPVEDNLAVVEVAGIVAVDIPAVVASAEPIHHIFAA